MPETAVRAGPREWLGLVVLSLPPLLIALDFTALHLAVPHLSADLQPTSTQMLWIVDIYGFLIAGLLVAMGTLGDRIGRRRLLLAGSAAFGLASLLAAFSGSAEMLIAARALLGITGATLLPSTLALISNMFRDPAQRRFAIAVWSTNFMLGGAVGPLVGGALLEAFWWGAVFLPAVPVMVLLLVLGPLVLPEFKSASAGKADAVSVALAIAALLPIVYGIKELAADGFAVPPVLALLAGAGVGWVFLHRQRRLVNPLLDLTLFSSRGFTVSIGAQTTGLFVLAALQFFVMQYLQLVLGLSPLAAGLWTVPAMVAGIVGSLVIPALARRIEVRALIATGFGLAAGGAVLVALADSAGLTGTIIGFIVLNLGLNPVMVLTYDLIIGSVPAERAGTASGVAETGNELGIALGVAIAGSIGATVYRGQVTTDALPQEIPPALSEVARDTLGGAVSVARDLPGSIGDRLLAVANDGFLQGMQVVAIVLAVLTAGMLILVTTLLRGNDGDDDTGSSPEHAADEPEDCPDDDVVMQA